MTVSSIARRRQLGRGGAGYSATVLADSPINFWKLFTDGTDFGSQGNNMGTWVGSPTYTAGGPFGTGYVHFGADALIGAGNGPTAFNSGPTTYEAIIRPGVSNSTGAIIQYGESTCQRGWAATGSGASTFSSGYPGTGLGAQTTDPGNWQHLVMTVSGVGTNQTVNFYFNGNLVFTSSAVSYNTTCSDTWQPTIGGAQGGTAGWSFTGCDFCCVAAYASVLSATRVTAHYNAFVGGRP